MAKGIHDLGNGFGYIYKVDVNKTDILQAYDNTEENAREIKVEGVRATSSGLNQAPTSIIVVDTVTGVGSVTAITINGVNQIDTGSPINYTGATSVDTLASDISDAINSYSANTGSDYTSIAIGDKIYIRGEEAIGSTDNAVTPIITTTGNSTYTTNEVQGGSDAKNLYNESYGFTFFLDADYDASGCSGLGVASEDSILNAVEITKYIVPRTLNSALPVISKTISSGAINPSGRSSVLTHLNIDTESAAASDDLDSIRTEGYADGDMIIIRGVDSGRVTTVKHGTGNINLEGGLDFLTGDLARAITLQLKDSQWYEVNRTSQSVGVTSDYRSAGFGFFGVDTFNTAAVASSGSTTFVAGTDSKYQKLTGTSVLSGNTDYSLDGTAENGDSFILEYDASVTDGAFSLSIFGITLTEEQALNGGLIFEAEYKSGAWYPRVYPNVNDSSTYTWQADTPDVKDGAITAVKLDSDLIKGFFTKEISFEATGLGIVDVEVPFALTVNKIIASVSENISGTDDATLIMKDDAAVAMTNGQIDIPASTVVGNTFTTVPTANNTFTANQNIKFETQKSTAGGRATVTIHYTRN